MRDKQGKKKKKKKTVYLNYEFQILSFIVRLLKKASCSSFETFFIFLLILSLDKPRHGEN